MHRIRRFGTVPPRSWKPRAEEVNASRTGDGRPRQADRRRPIPIWVRDVDRIRQGAEGPVGGYGPFHLGQEARAGLDAGVAAGSLSALADHDGADLGARPLSQDRLPGSLLLLRAEAEEADRLARRDRSRDSQDI